jgi:hypothetical protein
VSSSRTTSAKSALPTANATSLSRLSASRRQNTSLSNVPWFVYSADAALPQLFLRRDSELRVLVGARELSSCRDSAAFLPPFFRGKEPLGRRAAGSKVDADEDGAVLFVAAPRSSVLLVEALLLVLPRPPFGRSIDSFSEHSRSLELLDERVEVDEEEAEAVLEILAPSLVLATSLSVSPSLHSPSLCGLWNYLMEELVMRRKQPSTKRRMR